MFDGEGQFCGRVRVWSGFYPMVITREAMVGVWRDSVGVEYIRVYRLTPATRDRARSRGIAQHGPMVTDP